MSEIYYNEINYFEPIAGMKQTAAHEAANKEAGAVALSDFKITEAKESKKYKLGDDIESHMMEEVANMQDGELRYAKIEELGQVMVAPKAVEINIDKVNDTCKEVLNSKESVVVDDEGNIVDVAREEIFGKMAEEDFTKCYYVKNTEGITKYEPCIVKEAGEYSKTMEVNKYAVYGRI